MACVCKALHTSMEHKNLGLCQTATLNRARAEGVSDVVRRYRDCKQYQGGSLMPKKKKVEFSSSFTENS
jgi:hypothetical protein